MQLFRKTADYWREEDQGNDLELELDSRVGRSAIAPHAILHSSHIYSSKLQIFVATLLEKSLCIDVLDK